MDNYRHQHKIDCIPYIPDIHDETNWCVADGEQERSLEMVEYSYDRLNDELDWTVVFRHGGISFGNNLAIRCD